MVVTIMLRERRVIKITVNNTEMMVGAITILTIMVINDDNHAMTIMKVMIKVMISVVRIIK